MFIEIFVEVCSFINEPDIVLRETKGEYTLLVLHIIKYAVTFGYDECFYRRYIPPSNCFDRFGIRTSVSKRLRLSIPF